MVYTNDLAAQDHILLDISFDHWLKRVLVHNRICFLRSRKPCKNLHCGKKKSMYTDLVSVHDQLRKFRIKILKGWNIQQPRISNNLLQVSVYSTLHSKVSLIEC